MATESTSQPSLDVRRVLRRVLRYALRIGVPVAAVLLAIAYVFIAYTIASSLTSVDRLEQKDHPGAYGLEFEDVSFLSRQGDVTLEGWYIPGEGDGPTLIFAHGITSVRSGDERVELAARLVPMGFGVLMFDQRAHGSSGGEQTSYGYYERMDVLGGLDFLTGRGVPAGTVGLLGVSMGAGTALLAAAEEPAIRAVVADSPYARASDLIVQEIVERTSFPGWLAPIFAPGAKLIASVLFDIEIRALVPEEAVENLDYPILVIHGTGDTRIPVEHGQRVHAASLSASDLWLVPGVDHVGTFKEYPDEYVDRIVTYFKVRLGGQ